MTMKVLHTCIPGTGGLLPASVCPGINLLHVCPICYYKLSLLRDFVTAENPSEPVFNPYTVSWIFLTVVTHLLQLRLFSVTGSGWWYPLKEEVVYNTVFWCVCAVQNWCFLQRKIWHGYHNGVGRYSFINTLWNPSLSIVFEPHPRWGR